MKSILDGYENRLERIKFSEDCKNGSKNKLIKLKDIQK
jgi:hypothetical protein